MKRRNTSYVWTHFNKISDTNVQCSKCSTTLNFSSSTSAMKKHLETAHHLFDPESSASLSGQRSLKDCGVSVTNTSNRPCPEKRQEQIVKLVADMVARHNLPLHMCEWGGFRELISYLEPNFKHVSYETISKIMKERAQVVKQSIKEEIAKAKHICLTCDAWTSINNECYLAVTGSFITEKMQIRTPVLDTVLLTERHKAAYLELELEKVIQEWEIPGKIVAVVHDNASNVHHIAENISLNDAVDIGCAAHTLQLAIADAMGTKLPVANSPISRAVNSTSRLVGHFNHSNSANTELQKRQLIDTPDSTPVKLIQYCRTRWNSICDMFERTDKLSLSVKAVLNSKEGKTPAEVRNNKSFDLKQDQWDLIEEILPLLKQLKIANSLLCGEKYVTLSVIYPIINALLLHTVRKEDDSVVLRTFKLDLRAQIEKRFLTPKNQFIELATSLDPRYKSLATFSEKDKHATMGRLRELVMGCVIEEGGETPAIDDDDFFGSDEVSAGNTMAPDVEFDR